MFSKKAMKNGLSARIWFLYTTISLFIIHNICSYRFHPCLSKFHQANRLNLFKTLSILEREKISLPDIKVVLVNKHIKTYCLSDLHADTTKKFNWIGENCKRKENDNNSFTILILPGDVATEIERLEQIFITLLLQYDSVCYVVGNHELWRRGTATGGSAYAANTDPSASPSTNSPNRMADNSIIKCREVLALCSKLGIYTGPVIYKYPLSPTSTSTVTICPLMSWYE